MNEVILVKNERDMIFFFFFELALLIVTGS